MIPCKVLGFTRFNALIDLGLFINEILFSRGYVLSKLHSGQENGTQILTHRTIMTFFAAIVELLTKGFLWEVFQCTIICVPRLSQTLTLSERNHFFIGKLSYAHFAWHLWCEEVLFCPRIIYIAFLKLKIQKFNGWVLEAHGSLQTLLGTLYTFCTRTKRVIIL